MTKVKSLQKKKEKIESQLSSVQNQLNDELGKKFVRCEKCGKRTQVKKLTYLQTRYYIRSHGCYEGDYWLDGEGQFDCPKCGFNNRLYDRPDAVDLKRHFGKIEEVEND